MIKILILGGGFGGVRCALDLDKKIGKEAEITLIDKNSYHLFVPAIYEVASDRILILGGGFGGVRCALDLDKKIGKEAEITLIDKNSYHLFVPAIYEVA